jgi:hypothetical protein
VADYLIHYGKSGILGRFTATAPLECRRGEEVIIDIGRRLEWGVVLCTALPEFAGVLSRLPAGQLLRRATPGDEQVRQQLHAREHQLFDRCQQLVQELALPLEVLDVELSFDGRQLRIHGLAPPDCPLERLEQSLQEREGLSVYLENLAMAPPREEEGCGQAGCGRAAGGACSTCQRGCTSCAAGLDLRDFFAQLGAQQEEHSRRKSLL